MAASRPRPPGLSRSSFVTGVQDAYAHAVLAIVPVKSLDGAKTRLAPLLTPEERAQLVADMLERVLSACSQASVIRRTLLVTPDPSLARDGVELLLDGGTGHADAIALALADPRAGAGALVVMADCPLATAGSLDALAEAARPLALFRACDGGVNALALRDTALFAPRFGKSAEAMIADARRAGIEPAVVDDGGLEVDVDRPEDYELLARP
jgi:2-phospho-L-lactate/phosphoenolpyruvate guanylyltransferase